MGIICLVCILIYIVCCFESSRQLRLLFCTALRPAGSVPVEMRKMEKLAYFTFDNGRLRGKLIIVNLRMFS